MRKKICGIYMFTNKTTKILNENEINMRYIGQSVDILKRFVSHRAATDKTPIHYAFKKYGFENFEFEILEECSFEELDEKEKFYISKYNSVLPFGYNCDGGGQNFQDPQQFIDKCKNRSNKETNPWKQKGGHWRTGKNNYQSRQVAANDGRVWDTVGECQKELKMTQKLGCMLNGNRPMNNKIAHLDLHYVDDVNWKPKTKEELDAFINRNWKGINNKNAVKVLDKNEIIVGGITDIAEKHNLNYYKLRDMLENKRDFPEALAYFGYHLETDKNYIKKTDEEIKQYYIEKEINKKYIISNDGRTWDFLYLAAKELNIDKNNLSKMLLGKQKFRKNIFLLDLHYSTDKNHINKTKEECQKILDEFKPKVYTGAEHPKSKKIVDNIGRIWDSIASAAKELDVNVGDLCSMLRGKIKFRKDLKLLELKYLD